MQLKKVDCFEGTRFYVFSWSSRRLSAGYCSCNESTPSNWEFDEGTITTPFSTSLYVSLLIQPIVRSPNLHPLSWLPAPRPYPRCHSLCSCPVPSTSRLYHRASRCPTSQRRPRPHEAWRFRLPRLPQRSGQEVFPNNMADHCLGSWHQCYTLPPGH